MTKHNFWLLTAIIFVVILAVVGQMGVTSFSIVGDAGEVKSVDYPTIAITAAISGLIAGAVSRARVL